MFVSIDAAAVLTAVPVIGLAAALTRWAKTPHKESHKRIEVQISEIYSFVITKQAPAMATTATRRSAATRR